MPPHPLASRLVPDAPPLLRPGVLETTTVLVAPATAQAAASACAQAGATVLALEADALDEDATQAATRPCDALLIDAAAFTNELDDAGLRRALDATWPPVRAVANAYIAADRPGKILLLGPRPTAGDHAEALRAALENLARTTSIEWSRFGITITAILPGSQTTDGELADLIAYVVSPAGDYYSGCALTLG